MDEEVRRRLAYEAQRREQRGESHRSISRVLGIHRNTVRKLLEELAARREQGESAIEREVPPPPVRRSSKLDAFAERIESWLAMYENLTAVRLHEMLEAAGFTGRYTIVREYLRRVRGVGRPKQAFQVVETPAGYQAQFDWSPYVLPGCGQKVQFWGCSLTQLAQLRPGFPRPVASAANWIMHLGEILGVKTACSADLGRWILLRDRF